MTDNAPTADRDYVDGVTAIWRSGRTQQGRCKRGSLLTAEGARDALEHGAVVVFVRREDAGSVVEAVSGADG